MIEMMWTRWLLVAGLAAALGASPAAARDRDDVENKQFLNDEGSQKDYRGDDDGPRHESKRQKALHRRGKPGKGGRGRRRERRRGVSEEEEIDFHRKMQKGEVLFDLMMAYRKAGRLDDAISVGREIVELPLPVDPRIPQSLKAAAHRIMIYGELSEMHLEKGDVDEAMATIQEGLERIRKAELIDAPQKKAAQVRLLQRAAHIHEERGETEEMIRYLEQARALLQ